MKNLTLVGISVVCAGVATAMGLAGCATQPPQRVSHIEPLTFGKDPAPGGEAQVRDENDPRQIVAFALNLSERGKHAEAARIFNEAAQRFCSENNELAVSCRAGAANESLMAGDAEGFRIAVKDDLVLIGGETDVGTLFGAYEWLNRLGCDWVRPDEIGEIVPAVPTVTVPDMDESQKADLLSFVRDDGKGFVGVHSAPDTFYKWPEYGEMVGGYFDGHPWNTFKAPILIEDPRTPMTAHFAVPEIVAEVLMNAGSVSFLERVNPPTSPRVSVTVSPPMPG